MDTLFCPHCKKQVEFYTEMKANNNVARCLECETFIKNIPYEKPMLYVGKYKNKPIEDLDDLNYLQWAEKTLNVNERTHKALRERISQLEFLAK